MCELQASLRPCRSICPVCRFSSADYPCVCLSHAVLWCAVALPAHDANLGQTKTTKLVVSSYSAPSLVTRWRPRLMLREQSTPLRLWRRMTTHSWWVVSKEVVLLGGGGWCWQSAGCWRV